MTLSTTAGPPFRRDPEIPETLAAYVDGLVDRWPGGRFTEIGESGELEVTRYDELHARSRRILSALRTYGVDSGHVLVLVLARASDFISAAWACIHGGHTWIPWSPGQPSEPGAVFATGLRSLTEGIGTPLVLACDVTAPYLTRDPGVLAGCPLLNIDAIGDETIAPLRSVTRHGAQDSGECLVSTSGATGLPKLARLPHRVLLSRYARSPGSARPLNTLSFAPTHTISGLGIVLPVSDFTVHMRPARLATHPHDVFEQIENLGIQWIGLSSYIAAMLIHAYEHRRPRADLSSLTHLTFGMDFIVHSRVKRLVQCLHEGDAGTLHVSYVYGMTECGPICRRNFSDRELEGDSPEHQQAAELGEVFPGWRLRVVDDAGHLVEEEQVGHIEVWSDTKLFRGYPLDANMESASFCPDGWFRTGDMGRMRDGRLTITGRESTKLVAASGSLSVAQIEAAICDLPGLYQSMVMAVPLRTEDMLSDELVVFFAADRSEESSIDALRTRIAGKIATITSARLRELVAIEPGEFRRTATGKIQRSRMLEGYLRGEWSGKGSGTGDEGNDGSSDIDLHVLALWKKLLGLERSPPRGVSFFELGGDSLAAAELISSVEDWFGCELPLAEFYRKPTIDRLVTLLEGLPKGGRRAETRTAQGERHDDLKIVHRVESYLGSWQGTRLFEGGLVVGRSTTGHKPPLFWVFQSEGEFRSLATHLGAEQPVYGLRSLVDVVPLEKYTADRIGLLVDRYLWEILAMPVTHPIVLGGNCQGAIIALALAKTMKRINRAPALLVLMEWDYSYGRYTDPVCLAYGTESHTARRYAGATDGGLDWRGDFPNHTVSAIPGAHGRFFTEPNVRQLARVLERQFEAHTASGR